MRRPLLLALAAAVLALSAAFVVGACGGGGAENARRRVRRDHMPAIAKIIREDIARQTKGMDRAAERLAPGFEVPPPDVRERQVRVALKRLQEPPRGVTELIVSPMSFLAAVTPDGRVLARDADPDPMRGMNLAAQFPVVRAALAGSAGYQIGMFRSLERGGEPSVTLVFAAPSRRQGRVVGAVVSGIPLWRLEQRLSRQLQADNADETGSGVILWSYVYKGPHLYHQAGAHPDLDQIVPNDRARRAGLARSPGGFTGEVHQYSRWYGYGVVPIKRLGPDVGVIIFRSDPI